MDKINKQNIRYIGQWQKRQNKSRKMERSVGVSGDSSDMMAREGDI